MSKYQVDPYRVDFDFNEVFDDVAVTEEVTPMQGYAMLAMDKLKTGLKKG